MTCHKVASPVFLGHVKHSCHNASPQHSRSFPAFLLQLPALLCKTQSPSPSSCDPLCPQGREPLGQWGNIFPNWEHSLGTRPPPQASMSRARPHQKLSFFVRSSIARARAQVVRKGGLVRHRRRADWVKQRCPWGGRAVRPPARPTAFDHTTVCGSRSLKVSSLGS